MTDESEKADGRGPAGAGEREPDDCPTLIVLGGDDDLVCVDDTCVPVGAAR